MQVFTCGDNSSFCCGHRDTSRPIFRPRLVDALKAVPCKQVPGYAILLLQKIYFVENLLIKKKYFVENLVN